MTWSNWYKINKDRVDSVPKSRGIYQLKSNKEIIYIGMADHLKDRLKDHIDSDDKCIKKAVKFRYQKNTKHVTLEKDLLKKYKKKYGKLPRCNDRIG